MPWDEAGAPALTRDTGVEMLPERATAHAPEGAAVLQYAWLGAWVVVARGAYDMASISPLSDALRAAVREHPKVVLDASGITFADSTLLNLLILTHRTGTLRVVAPSPQLQRLCEITGVDSILEMRASLDEAAVS
ncbi:STAS domain-containing protein [Streptomyces sp. NEAU-H22]|uniref:STAS domain-containing protein n=1 Tax=unclassified Streptomyces TaxID=2593676 RepID=UPI0022507972|nr:MULTISPECIES: STAS domain-containing protein [unclassified Streptomyces]MCX3291898.1 STAS domain-containing protein [Streptomyces sp. NEAU-H22]WMD06892.1 STAS domain-containing protein [Streptomyces sp. FXY-T5]